MLALAAVIVASAAALPILGRLWVALAAIVAILGVGASRLGAALRAREEPSAAAELARRIRENRRLGERRG